MYHLNSELHQTGCYAGLLMSFLSPFPMMRQIQTLVGSHLLSDDSVKNDIKKPNTSGIISIALCKHTLAQAVHPQHCDLSTICIIF